MSQTHSQQIWTYRVVLYLYAPTLNFDHSSSHFRLYWTKTAPIYSQKGSSCLTKPEVKTLGKNTTGIPLLASVCFKQCSTRYSFQEAGPNLHVKFCCILTHFIFPYLNYYNFNQKTASSKSKSKVLTSFTSKHEFTSRTSEVQNARATKSKIQNRQAERT